LGDGDIADDAGGELVNGLVDFYELPQMLVIVRAVFVAEDGRVRREEGREFVDVFTGFDGVGADFGSAFFGFWPFGFGAVFAGDFGSFFFAHKFLSWV